ncbi:MAG: tyrosine-type recombinase/integrase, partial [Helicobacter sp.]|nr:tyrosine-type recombinase/integrase [Helicobacter sp.]
NYTSSSSLAYRWSRALHECNIAYRSVYHTRHTFATTMISAGEDILWVSATLGHANTQMTFARYAKYIPKTRRQRESIVEQNIAQLLAQHGNALAL